MIHFAPFHTRRLNVEFREISIADAVRLANIPDARSEAAITELLRMATRPLPGMTLLDPAQWSVQERMLGVGYYLAHVAEDGPDFSLGNARYSDYLVADSDYPSDNESVRLGDVGGDAWHMQPLLGAEAEAIESMGEGILHWLTGAMAAQMRREGETDRPDAFVAPARYREWLRERMDVIQAYAESEFVLLLAQYESGMHAQAHFFNLEFSDSGPVAKGGDGSELPAARFPVDACITGISQALGRKAHQSGG